MLIGRASTGAGLVLLLGALAGTAGAGTPPARAAGKAFIYKATFAHFTTKEKVEYRGSTATWDAFGRVTQELRPSPLPIVLASSGSTAVTIATKNTLSGDETLTIGGFKAACSGEWHGLTKAGAIVLFVRQKGSGALATKWEIDTGNASEKCGRPYDLFGGSFTKTASVTGEIGDPHLNLDVHGETTKTSADRTTQQKVQWSGRVTLERISP
jgi:hypothetical protein